MGGVGHPRVPGALQNEEGKREQNLPPSSPKVRPSFLIAVELTADNRISREEPGHSGGNFRPGPYLPVRLSEWFGKIVPELQSLRLRANCTYQRKGRR
jgi:hypothetical protein